MRKVLVFIGLLFLLTKVYATDSEVWKDQIINDPNLYLKEGEIRYKWYKDSIIFSNDYYIEGENDPEYPYKDKDRLIITDFSEWSEVAPVGTKNRIIESKSAKRYRTFKPIRYIVLENFNGGGEPFFLNELYVFAENRQKNVVVTCTKCATDFSVIVSDGKLLTNSFIEEGGIITIDLGSYYGIDQMQLELFAYSKIKNIKSFDLYFKESLLSNENSGIKRITLDILSNEARRPAEFLFKFDSSYNYNFEFGNWVYVEWPLLSTFYREMQYLVIHRYRDVKYRYYKVERKYLEDYHSKITFNDYIKDEASAKIFYLYEQKTESNDAEDNEEVCVEKKASDDKSTNSNSGFINNVDDINDRINKKNTPDDDVVLNNSIKESSLQNKIENNSISKEKQKSFKNESLLKDKKFNVMYYKLLSIPIFIILLLLFIYLKIRHQNLSHQK